MWTARDADCSLEAKNAKKPIWGSPEEEGRRIDEMPDLPIEERARLFGGPKEETGPAKPEEKRLQMKEWDNRFII